MKLKLRKIYFFGRGFLFLSGGQFFFEIFLSILTKLKLRKNNLLKIFFVLGDDFLLGGQIYWKLFKSTFFLQNWNWEKAFVLNNLFGQGITPYFIKTCWSIWPWGFIIMVWVSANGKTVDKSVFQSFLCVKWLVRANYNCGFGSERERETDTWHSWNLENLF